MAADRLIQTRVMKEAWKLSIFVTAGEEVGVRVEGRGQVGLREREDNKWKPARSTLKVRKTLYSLLKNISICGTCVLFLVCW